MSLDYINEAFKKLDFLSEEMFTTDSYGINNLNSFIENDDDIVVPVIDAEATSTDDLKDSYLGKVIINCNVCHSHIFEEKDNIEINDEGNVNFDIPCPYCGEEEGFTVIGEIAPYSANSTDDVKVDVEADDDITDESEINESFTDSHELSNVEKLIRAFPGEFDHLIDRSIEVDEQLTESMNNVNVETDDTIVNVQSDENGKVTVSTEPKEASSDVTDETIVPLSDETLSEISSEDELIDTTDPSEFGDASELSDSTEEEIELEPEEIVEESFNQLGNDYFKRIYENVDNFTTTNVYSTPSKMIIEGVISFASGAKKNTGFIFEAKDIDANKKLRFVGTNKHLTESVDAFTLVGTMDNSKLVFESLEYNYAVDTTPVKGIIRRG